jgi:hypothetical protein
MSGKIAIAFVLALVFGLIIAYLSWHAYLLRYYDLQAPHSDYGSMTVYGPGAGKMLDGLEYPGAGGWEYTGLLDTGPDRHPDGVAVFRRVKK